MTSEEQVRHVANCFGDNSLSEATVFGRAGEAAAEEVDFVVEKGGDGGLAVAGETVRTVPEYLQEWARAEEEHEAAGRLVE